MKTYSSKISVIYNEQGLHINVSMNCSPTMSHIARCSCLVQTWLTGWSKRHRKDQNCCINQCGGESNYPKLMLYYTNTRKYCGKDANLQVNVVLCLPTWMGRCSPGHCSHWAKAWPGGNLRASEANKNTSGGADNPLTIFVKKDSKVWKIDGRFDPGWLWCIQPPSRDWM